MKATARLFLNAAKDALVAEGHKDAAFLYAAPGDDIPDSAAERFGLVEGAVGRQGGKSAPVSPNKDKKPDGDKSKKPDGDKSGGPTTDDLTELKGVGAATAKALVAAGIDSFAALAAIDPASPPELETNASANDWVSWTTQARAIVAAGAPDEPPASAPGGLTVTPLETAS
ncbi:hypothetical protein AWH62_00925 [Maricaulis sp. W15]|uniref:helix-hairpin-helix domain-containing protein n=1 Tax=Maricaulis sp. W15 TaxID=1772333 RepID=UPI00095A80DB|nr:helix-hairpin-helix domain-containing protein [Maricaulis sp. W15]OLF81269.1 hypothetical protein AWH62_00925 [Maricaulis sp. W15]